MSAGKLRSLHSLFVQGVTMRTVPGVTSEGENGAQIDLLIDRRDRAINLCEIKYSNGPYEIDKTGDLDLKNKVAVFKDKTQNTKTIIVKNDNNFWSEKK